MPRAGARISRSALWALDPEVDFLNHGSFGACPRAVLEHQDVWRRRLERDPVRFLIAELEPALDGARREIAAFAGAEPSDIVFTANATTAVNTVLAGLELAPDDEILITNHTYAACKNAAQYWAKRAGARVRVADVPFPISDGAEVALAVLAAVNPRTRLALLDHVTSPTALIFPVRELVRELSRRGVQTLIDGAHALGMLEVDVGAIGADYYTANLHKWCCAPKGAALLHVRRDHQQRLRPLVVSHGYGSAREGRPRFLVEFDWTGTADPSAVLAAPFALRFLSGLLPGGLPEVQARNTELARAARRRIAEAQSVELPCPDEMIGSMASLVLPGVPPAPVPGWPFVEPLYGQLCGQRMQVPVFYFPDPRTAVLRISAHLYNEAEQYERLITALDACAAGDVPDARSAARGWSAPRPRAAPERRERAGSAPFSIWRVAGQRLVAAEDDVAVEEPLEIRVGGDAFVTTMRTPGSVPELVAGLLLAEGVIASRRDVSTIAPCGRPGEQGYGNVMDVALTSGVAPAPSLAEPPAGRLATSACGVCGRRTIDDLLARLTPLADSARFDPEWLAGLPDALRSEQPNFVRTGGLHAAGVARAGEALGCVREDVGRHNAVDKVIGRLLLDDALPAAGTALVVSGRTSFEIVQKALVARIPAVISVSAPSSLAIATAARSGMLLAGFARNGVFNLYTGRERLSDASA